MSGDRNPAEVFADMMFAHHAELLTGDDIEARDAVIVKMVALTALAFDIPPTSDEPIVDVDDCIDKLRNALAVIADKEKSKGIH